MDKYITPQKVSIIFPVYNTGEKLKKCFNSIIKQKLKDFEVICVNDGSTDEQTLDLLDYFSTRDKRFKVLHQINSGPGSARNNGIQHAQGKYCAFIDSDDYISRNFLDSLYKAAEKHQSDISITPKVIKTYPFRFNRIKKLGVDFYGRESSLNFTSRILKKSSIARNKLYRNDFIKKHHIEFHDAKICPGGDSHFSYLAMIFAGDNISIAKNGIYYYHQHNEAITKKPKNSTGVHDTIAVYESLINKINKKNIQNKQYWINLVNIRATKDLKNKARICGQLSAFENVIAQKFRVDKEIEDYTTINDYPDIINL